MSKGFSEKVSKRKIIFVSVLVIVIIILICLFFDLKLAKKLSFSADTVGAGAPTTITDMATISYPNPTNTANTVTLTSNTVVLTVSAPAPTISPSPTLSPLRGDINGDGVVNITDWSMMKGQWGSTNGGMADINGDGVVNITDWSIMKGNWTQ